VLATKHLARDLLLDKHVQATQIGLRCGIGWHIRARYGYRALIGGVDYVVVSAAYRDRSGGGDN